MSFPPHCKNVFQFSPPPPPPFETGKCRLSPPVKNNARTVKLENLLFYASPLFLSFFSSQVTAAIQAVARVFFFCSFSPLFFFFFSRDDSVERAALFVPPPSAAPMRSFARFSGLRCSRDRIFPFSRTQTFCHRGPIRVTFLSALAQTPFFP